MFAAKGGEISGNLDRPTGALNVRFTAPRKLVDDNGGGEPTSAFKAPDKS